MVYGDDGQKQTSTLVLGFPRGMAAPPMKVMPATMNEDIARIAAETEAIFIQAALPFYERFADLREIEELANKHPLIDLIPYTVGLPMEHRAMRSLLLAKAVNPQALRDRARNLHTVGQGNVPAGKAARDAPAGRRNGVARMSAGTEAVQGTFFAGHLSDPEQARDVDEYAMVPYDYMASPGRCSRRSAAGRRARWGRWP